ncbi:MAG: hypothetical protein GY948_18095 [Alphaproteobacteria bacterium]|nr:hypothetical protein [Alphaproteobacteria bacterium]
MSGLRPHTALKLDDVPSVFQFVLNSLPDRVKVYPTENYFYFYFHQNGVKYAGNIRLDVGRRDEGFINFAYFRASTHWASDQKDYGAVLGANQGVTVEKKNEFAYKISAGGKSVVFELNDLSDVRPPEGIVRAGENYLGPVFDESGVRFFLIFDKPEKKFRYVLDETVPLTDQLVAGRGLNNTVIGWRTGFAFLKEGKPERKVLIGIYRANADVNNYLDGPFDQLPDNFLKGDELRQALLITRPHLKGKIDRFGNALDREERELIAPYAEYETVDDLKIAEECATERKDVTVSVCFEAAIEKLR